jgi:long-chain acyl-CoA synthetase
MKEHISEVLALPLFHSFGLGRMRAVFKVGGCLILCPSFISSARYVVHYKADGFASVPMGLQLLKKRDIETYRRMTNFLNYLEIGSSPLLANEKQEIATDFKRTRVVMHYGLTEASRTTFLDFHDDLSYLHTVGRPPEGVRIEILKRTAEIVVHGSNVSDQGRGRVIHTGDMGRLENGYLLLFGRLDDKLNIGGFSFMPNMVEEYLKGRGIDSILVQRNHGGFDRLFLFVRLAGSSDELMGVDPLAFAKSVKSALVNHKGLPNYMIPHRVVVVSDFQRTHNGKVRRKAEHEALQIAEL